MAKEQGFSPFAKQCFVSSAVCCNVLGFGCMVGFPAVLLPQLRQPGSFMALTRDQESWITSLMGFAMLVGNLITPPVMDSLGRRPVHGFVGILAVAGWAINALATDFYLLFFARTLLGIGFGIHLSLRSALIGEYSSPKHRGSFLALIALSQCTGVFLVHLLGTLFHWQTTAVICMFFPFISLVMTIYSPESPSFLAARGRYEECREVFRWLRGYDEEMELENMISTRQEFDRVQPKMNFRRLLIEAKKKEFYKPVLIMIHANIMMQFSGGPTAAAYSTVIIFMIMGPTANAHFWMVFLDGQRSILNTIAVFIMDKFKRRTMLFTMGTLSVFSHFGIAMYVYLRNNGIVGDYLWISIILVNVQFFAMAVGLVPIPGVIAGEIYPFQYRGVGSSISMVFISMTTFMILKSFPALTDNIGIEGTYSLYGGIIAYTLVVNWFLLPETKGKTLQEIEDELRGYQLKPEEIEEVKALQQNSRRVSMWSTYSMTVEL